MEVTNSIRIGPMLEVFTSDLLFFFLRFGGIIALIALVTFIILFIIGKKKNVSKTKLRICITFIVISAIILLLNIILWGIVIYALTTMDLSFLNEINVMELM